MRTEMNQRTTYYLILILVLVGANAYLLLSDGKVAASSFDDERFTVKDTAEVQSVVITHQGTEIALDRVGSDWRVNDRYPADQSFLRVLFSILNRIKVKKKVGVEIEKVDGQVRLTRGAKVTTFQYGTDPLGTKTYFSEGAAWYQVEVPGYKENVASIFRLNEDQWRDRLVFDGSWRTIQRLSLQMAHQEILITFKEQFFEVDGLQAIDSGAVVDYLNQFQLFQANEMVSEGRFPRLDSLRSQAPMATLTIEDIQYADTKVLDIYPKLPDQSYHLVTDESQQMMVFSASRIRQILKDKAEFKLN